ncbi:MAG: hypothetical protein WCK89_11090 [bacterium]
MKNIVSISEAARTCGIDRKTVQRYLNSGSIRRHGDNGHGRNAKCVDMAELRAALAAPLADGRETDRRSLKPVVEQIRTFLKGVLGDEDAKRLIGIYLAAAENGADLDFLLFCVERLREGNPLFVRMALGMRMPPLRCEPLHRYAAARLLRLAAGHLMDIGTYGFVGWWRAFSRACFKAPLEVDVAIVHDNRTSKATLELVPKWLEKAPPGLLPMAGGHHSVASVRWGGEDRALVNHAATKASIRLGQTKATLQMKRLAALRSFKDETFLYSGNAWGWMLDIDAGRTLLNGESGLPISGRAQKALRNAHKSLKAASELLGLDPEETRVLLRAWKRLTADVLSRASFPYNDGIRSNTGGTGIRIFTTVVAEVMGVSRTTLAKWNRDAGGAMTAARRKTLGVRTVTPGRLTEDDDGADGKPEEPDGDRRDGRPGAEDDIYDLLHPNGPDADD